MEELLHMAMQKYRDALCATQWQTNLTTSSLQDISKFDGQDCMKLEDLLMDIETTTDILKESQACLAGAESHSLTLTLIHRHSKQKNAGMRWRTYSV